MSLCGGSPPAQSLRSIGSDRTYNVVGGSPLGNAACPRAFKRLVHIVRRPSPGGAILLIPESHRRTPVRRLGLAPVTSRTVVPLACDGPDAVSNMQWQTIRDAKAKNRWETKGCVR